MTEHCPVCGDLLDPAEDPWLHLQEAHGPGVTPHGPGVTPHGPGVTPHGPGVTPHGPGVPPHGPGATPHGPELKASIAPKPTDTPATLAIVGITIGVWLAHLLLLQFGVDTDRALAGNGMLGTDGEWWRLNTALVVHFGLLHITFNMLWTYQLGGALERVLGRARLVVIYLVTGLAGNVCSDLIYFHQRVLSGGASGAVYGLGGVLVGGYFAARREQRRSPLAALGPGAVHFNGEAVRSLGLVFGAYLLIGNLIHVDTAAHFGGGVVGLVIGWVLIGSRNRPVAGARAGQLASLAAAWRRGRAGRGDEHQEIAMQSHASSRIAAATLLATLVVAGCGSKSSTSSSVTTAPPDTTTTAAAPPTSALSAAAAAATALYQPAMLRAADLPSGWTDTPSLGANSKSGDQGQAAFDACVGVKDTSKDIVAEINSDNFSSGDLRASSSGTVFSSSADVQQDVAAFASPKATKCISDTLRAAAAGQAASANATIGNIDIKLTPGAAPGRPNQVGVASGTVQLTVPALGTQPITLYVWLSFLKASKGEIQVQLTDINAPIPTDIENNAANAVAARAAKV